MADVHNKDTRSYNMSRIRSKNTKPEILVRKFLHSHGFRFRIHVDYLPGKPDIVLLKYKTVILIHGCFWHGHESCTFARIPKSNVDYWSKKLSNNIKRDKQHIEALKKIGWSVIIIWECQLKKPELISTLEQLIATIKKNGIRKSYK